MENKNYKFETLQVRAGQEIDPVSKGTAVPIYQSTAYTFDSMEYGAELFELKRPGNIYTRITNTTNEVFEKRMAALEGGVAAVATASGQSAVFLSITNICGPGDNIVAQPFLYGGTFTMFAITLRDMGIQVRFAKSDKVEDLEALVDDRTKAIYLENLGNPAFNIPDYEPIAEMARRKGICVMVDNTFGMGGYLFRPFEWGAHYHISNPMSEVSVPRKRSSEIMLLDADEQKRLQRYLDVNPDRTTMGIALSLHMGIRIGELCALQWSDIDLKKRILTVRKTIQRIQCQEQGKRTKLIVTEPKSESSKRCIPIPEFLLDILKKFSGNTKEFVLSGKMSPIEPRTMQYRFVKILKNVKLPSIHFHALRHMFASNCVKLGFDIKALSEILGHSSVEITLNRYVHSSFEQKVEYMKLLKPAV